MSVYEHQSQSFAWRAVKKLYANDPVATGGVPDLKVTDEEAARAR